MFGASKGNIGRKLDVGIEVLRNIKGDTSALVIEQRGLKEDLSTCYRNARA